MRASLYALYNCIGFLYYNLKNVPKSANKSTAKNSCIIYLDTQMVFFQFEQTDLIASSFNISHLSLQLNIKANSASVKVVPYRIPKS